MWRTQSQPREAGGGTASPRYKFEYAPRPLLNFQSRLRRLFEGGVYIEVGPCKKIVLTTVLIFPVLKEQNVSNVLTVGVAHSSKNVIYFEILTTDTVRRSENFFQKGFLFHCASYTSFKNSVMRPEAMKNNRANRAEKMNSLKEKKKSDEILF